MGSILTYINNINSSGTINQGNPALSNENGFRMNDIRNQQQISNDNLINNVTVTANNTTNISRLNLLAQLLNFNSSNNNNNNNLASNNNESKRQNKSNATDLINVNFSNHFYMTGKKIKNLANQAHLFLFGDQLDLSFIVSHKPVNFPYESPTLETPSNYLQSLVNIRKDTIKLVKYIEKEYCSVNNVNNGSELKETKYNIEFRFDCDCDVKIKIHYFAHESYSIHNSDDGLSNQLNYICGCSRSSISSTSQQNANKCICLKDDSKSVVFKKGVNILFRQQKHVIIPSKYQMSSWHFNLHENYYPIVIECRPVDEHLKSRHAHITLAYIDKLQTTIHNNTNTQSMANLNTNYSSNSSNSSAKEQNLNTKSASVGCLSQITFTYQIKVAKQKQFINGVLYSLQEIYGIEKKCSDIDLIMSTDLTANNNNNNGDTNSNNNELVSSVDSNTNTKSAKQKTISSCSLLSSSTTITTTSSSSNSDNENNNIVRIQNEILGQTTTTHNQDKEQEQKGIECVICMCEIRNTLILPCRHLCLCKICAINLRVQSNNCPICRIPFIALIQLKLYKKKQTHQQILNEKKDQLPKLELNDLNLVDEITNINDTNGNVIIEIKNRTTTNERNEMLVKSENINVKSVKTKHSILASQYESVNIYEAFDDNNLTEKNNQIIAKQMNLTQNHVGKKKEKKSKSKKSSSNNNPQPPVKKEDDPSSDNKNIAPAQSDFKFELNDDKQKLIAQSNINQKPVVNNINNDIRSCSVIIKPSNDNLTLIKSKSLSTNQVNNDSDEKIEFKANNSDKKEESILIKKSDSSLNKNIKIENENNLKDDSEI